MRGISDTRAKAAITALAAVAGLAYHRLGRPRMLRWGISEAGAVAPLPGDERLPDLSAGNNSTHAITIDAPLRRGPLGDGIHPESEPPGSRQIPYSPFNAIPVVAIEPEQYLIIGNSVAWVLQDLGGGRTRLIVRTRGYRWFRSLFRRFPILRQLAVAPAQRGQEAGRVAPSPDRRRCSWVWRGGVGRPRRAGPALAMTRVRYRVPVDRGGRIGRHHEYGHA